jgi:site-specific DNA-methyltransferase (adenine-specific)
MTTKRNTGAKGEQRYKTPRWIFEMLDAELGPFTLDACAEEWNAQCGRYFTKEQDGLAQSWKGETVYLNPPFSGITPWIEKAYHHALKGEAKTVCLLPANTDNSWFHDVASLGQVWFLRGRIQFEAPSGAEDNPKTGNNTGSIIVVFEPGKVLEPHGELSGPLQSRCWSPKRRQKTQRQEPLFGE